MINLLGDQTITRILKKAIIMLSIIQNYEFVNINWFCTLPKNTGRRGYSLATV